MRNSNSFIYKLFPATFEFLLELIGPALSATKSVSGRKPIAHKQLLIALWMMGIPDSYRSMCVKFNVGKATAIRTIRRVTYVLHILASRFIQWPRGERELLMALILTSELHRRINNHMNRKGHHSIHVQAVCTQNLFFTSVLAGNVGSVHDARVLRLSPVSHYIKIHRYTFLIILTLLEMLARIAIERTFVERDGEAFLICL